MGALSSNARQLYDQPGAAVPSAGNLGVRYGLLRRGADGEYRSAPLDTTLHPGDAVRVRLEPNDAGYVYLFERDATGGWRLAATERVEPRQPSFLPAAGALQYDSPGRKELLLVLSRQEDPALAGMETAQLDALARAGDAGILHAAASSEDSAYAVETRPQTGPQRVAFEIILEYR